MSAAPSHFQTRNLKPSESADKHLTKIILQANPTTVFIKYPPTPVNIFNIEYWVLDLSITISPQNYVSSFLVQMA